MKIYIQYHSPTRGSQRPILFATAVTPEESVQLIAKAKAEFISNTTAFVGIRCKQCKVVCPADTVNGGYCNGCCRDMAEEDKEEPDGGAYREHQWS